jgi:3,4-dihydroxy-2-butanone 4-phosphate synthase
MNNIIMTEKEKQAIITSFKGKVRELNVSLGISSEDRALSVTVENPETHERFNLIIDQDYINQQE